MLREERGAQRDGLLGTLGVFGRHVGYKMRKWPKAIWRDGELRL